MCLIRVALGHLFPEPILPYEHPVPLPTSPSQETGAPSAPNCVFTLLSNLFLIFPFCYSLTSEARVVGIAGDIFPSGLEVKDRG